MAKARQTAVDRAKGLRGHRADPVKDSILRESPDPLAAARPGATSVWSAIGRARLGINSLLLLVALYLSLIQNLSFWHQVAAALPPDVPALGLRLSLLIALNVIFLIVMMPFSLHRLVKPFAILLVLVAAVSSYFMDSFGTVIDQAMIVNLLQTDPREAGELLSLPMLRHVLLSGALPAVLIARVELVSGSRFGELWRRLLLLVLGLGLLLVCVLANYKDVSLWARTNRHVRMYVNPTYPIYAFTRQLKANAKSHAGPVAPIALDAQRQPAASGKPRVVVMVVGETARAANFQLDGYARATTPVLAATPGVVNLSQLRSCGTATAVSVPCMFSRLDRADFSRSKAKAEENVLDVLQRTGVAVQWRDNNSDSKGVAKRIPYLNTRLKKDPVLCDSQGCHDEILLQGLDEQIANSPGDQLIVLHLLGSHGPSYYKRYPPAFRRFRPDCAQDDVQSCAQQDIVNAYDNTILYTDHVLGLLIAMLSRHQDRVEPTLIYMSDHGESLGENGLYLHGLPYAMAPQEQTHVPGVVWSPSLNLACMAQRKDLAYSHDNLFHTLLGLFDVSTTEYHSQADLLRGCQGTS